MQIKPIIAAAGAIVCLLLEWPAIVAGTLNPTGVAPNYGGQVAMAGKHFVLQAMAEDEADAQPEAAPATKSEEQDMTKTGEPAAVVPHLTTRPRVDRHRDARICLKAGDNLAIIKCAEKYRYR